MKDNPSISPIMPKTKPKSAKRPVAGKREKRPLTEYNKFISERLKEMKHNEVLKSHSSKQRFKIATQLWQEHKEARVVGRGEREDEAEKKRLAEEKRRLKEEAHWARKFR